jgi:hypothetical protein
MRRLPIGAQDAIPPHNARPMGTPLGSHWNGGGEQGERTISSSWAVQDFRRGVRHFDGVSNTAKPSQ